MKRQRITAWVLMAILFVHYIGVNAFYGLYVADQPLFIELFCVNKDKPKMHCNGSCMLSKLDEQKKQDSNKSVLPDIAQLQLYFYIQNPSLELCILTFPEVEHPYPYYQYFHHTQYIKKVFKPPILV